MARLHHAEDSSEEHKNSATVLQQVLQDFQKRKEGEIFEATEKYRNNLTKEEEKSQELQNQIKLLKVC